MNLFTQLLVDEELILEKNPDLQKDDPVQFTTMKLWNYATEIAEKIPESPWEKDGNNLSGSKLLDATADMVYEAYLDLSLHLWDDMHPFLQEHYRELINYYQERYNALDSMHSFLEEIDEQNDGIDWRRIICDGIKGARKGPLYAFEALLGGEAINGREIVHNIRRPQIVSQLRRTNGMRDSLSRQQQGLSERFREMWDWVYVSSIETSDDCDFVGCVKCRDNNRVQNFNPYSSNPICGNCGTTINV